MLHYDTGDHPLKPIYVVSITAGSGMPFQIGNIGYTDLRIPALSTMISADVFHYPDSNKYGIMANDVPFLIDENRRAAPVHQTRSPNESRTI